jgi:ABC-2 type transport system permease protein
MGNLMTLPLMFFSTAMVPESFMPKWIAAVATVNPINYAVEAVRAALIGTVNANALMTGLGVMVVFAAVSLAWAVSSFNSLRD